MRAFALLAAALLACLALVAGGCGSDGGRSAGQVLESASEKQAESADLDMSLELKLDGVERLEGPVRLSVKGPYRSNGPKRLPDFDFRIGYDAAAKKGSLRVIGAGQNAFVEYGGATYEVGRDLVRRQLERQPGGQPRVDGARWVKDGEVTDDGRTVRGEVDVARMLADVNRVIAQTPGGRQIPQRTVDRIEQAVTDASLEVSLGDDEVMRRGSFDLSFEVPEELRSQARGLRGGELRLRVRQSDVNGAQRIQAPTGARPLAELLRGFGVPPEALQLGPQAPG